jgi:hypothetical protein
MLWLNCDFALFSYLADKFPPQRGCGFVSRRNESQHYWVHVAIDRFTGQVIDKQIEVVNE